MVAGHRPAACGGAAASVAFGAAVRSVLVMLSPFAPHLCEELWERIGTDGTLATAHWPQADPRWLAKATQQLILKVNARPVGRLEVPLDAGRDEVLALVYQNEAIRSAVGGNEVTREVYVPGQVVNLVIPSGNPVSSPPES